MPHALAPVKCGAKPFDKVAYEPPPLFVQVPSQNTRAATSSYCVGWSAGCCHASA